MAHLTSVIAILVAQDRDCGQLRGFLATVKERLAELKDERRRLLAKQ